ncbi:MAG: ABC transporter permease [Lachnospiraceae bacterium]|jgi:putative ABC transport system permease protein|nr:ABC transporter permease [Lachnospiraceae bacterium]
MNVYENVRMAWEGLKANKMRALLTMLGIIIGIASVIGILTIGDGVSNTVAGAMGSLGASNISVNLQRRSSDIPGNRRIFVTEDDRITEEMIAALVERYSEAIAGIATSRNVGGGQVRDGRDYANVGVTGINDGFLEVNAVEMLRGRTFNERDLDRGRNVAIVSDRLVNNMFDGDMDVAIGQEIAAYVGAAIYPFVIIGVFEHEMTVFNFTSAAERDISTPLYIPITTAQRILNAPDGYTTLTVAAVNTVDSTAFADQIANFLNRYYTNNEYFFIQTMSMESMLESLNTMLATISIGLSVIAGISLLVGGIGVMNIMLVSVTERTREIGTRKALGATNGNIRVQFVVESMIVCLVGGMIGIFLGSVMGYIGTSIIAVAILPTTQSIAISVGFSLGIGLFFGYYPANKAAKLDPIEALRYE